MSSGNGVDAGRGAMVPPEPADPVELLREWPRLGLLQHQPHSVRI
jgi:hypothetical protein